MGVGYTWFYNPRDDSRRGSNEKEGHKSFHMDCKRKYAEAVESIPPFLFTVVYQTMTLKIPSCLTQQDEWHPLLALLYHPLHKREDAEAVEGDPARKEHLHHDHDQKSHQWSSRRDQHKTIAAHYVPVLCVSYVWYGNWYCMVCTDIPLWVLYLATHIHTPRIHETTITIVHPTTSKLLPGPQTAYTFSSKHWRLFYDQ